MFSHHSGHLFSTLSWVCLFQASGSTTAVRSVHLLLAVFREVTALYGFSDSSFHPKQQVRYCPLGACDKYALLVRKSEIEIMGGRTFCSGLCPGQGKGKVFSKWGKMQHEKQLLILPSLIGNSTVVLFLFNMCFQQTRALTEFIQNSKALSPPDLQNFATSLVMNALPSVLSVDPQSFSSNGALIEMAVHTMAVLLCGQNPILRPLRNLAFFPHTMEVKRSAHQ